MADNQILLNPPKEPHRWLMFGIDTLTWTLPVLAAVASIWAGAEALRGDGRLSALLSIAAAVFSATGVLFTNWASRIRDQRLAIIRAAGGLALEIADRADRRGGPQF